MALKVQRVFRDFQRLSEIFRIRLFIQNGRESAEKCLEVLRTVPPLPHQQYLPFHYDSEKSHI